MNKILLLFIGALGLLLGTACKQSERSSTTGWKYNDQEWGGFERLDYEGQATGPNLVPIEGGTFSMGQTEEDVTYEWNNIPRRVTVASFYMDETEVSNIDYREFLHWTKRVYGESYPQEVLSILPDTLVWREELAFNEPFVETYFRHPGYDDYPVVGVSWDQANKYTKWRTNRVNEMILIERGILNPNTQQKDSDQFDTEAYLAGQYQGSVAKNLEDKMTGGERQVRFEDGILLPEYRLPTEAEWEYAALALIGNIVSEKDELITDRRLYAWNDNTARYKKRDKYQGSLLANFKRSRGDYMGIAGHLNDNAPIPAPVRSFMPNDFGLYNMAGNVSEWTADVYRPMTSVTLRDVETHDLNPFRGNVFKTKVLDENGKPVEKDSLGHLRYRIVTDEEAAERTNYQVGSAVDYLDGDSISFVTYDYGEHTLISDDSRVIKGGSWADRLFWLSPGTRRFMDRDQSSNKVGFRCAMTRTGGASTDSWTGGLEFGNQKKKNVKRRYK
ncbi:MAG: SUMF1/EgtB/PvdO family nonheme iron enzyme [Saprospiraceae bacterium]|nr:SUMF1/EgtB/PvdO family nonheme iron enzyme [Saprospiraceae bacterium]